MQKNSVPGPTSPVWQARRTTSRVGPPTIVLSAMPVTSAAASMWADSIRPASPPPPVIAGSLGVTGLRSDLEMLQSEGRDRLDGRGGGRRAPDGGARFVLSL